MSAYVSGRNRHVELEMKLIIRVSMLFMARASLTRMLPLCSCALIVVILVLLVPGSCFLIRAAGALGLFTLRLNMVRLRLLPGLAFLARRILTGLVVLILGVLWHVVMLDLLRCDSTSEFLVLAENVHVAVATDCIVLAVLKNRLLVRVFRTRMRNMTSDRVFMTVLNWLSSWWTLLSESSCVGLVTIESLLLRLG